MKKREKKASGLMDMVIQDGVLVRCMRNTADIRIPDGVWKIGKAAFRGSRVRQVVFPEGLREIGSYAFADCRSLLVISLPSGMTRIGDHAFSKCVSLSAAFLPKGLKEMGSAAFEDCPALSSIRIPGSLTGIGNGTFAGCSGMRDAFLEEGVVSVGEEAFSGCGLQAVSLPSTLKKLGRRAFYGCRELAETEFPDSLQEIGEEAIYDCVSLERQEDLLICRDVLVQCFSPMETVRVPEGVARIGRGAFRDRLMLKRVILPDTLTGIGDEAFAECRDLTAIVIPDSVAEIGESAFMKCGKLTSVRLSAGLRVLGAGAFRECRHLRQVGFPRHLAVIGDNAFMRCSEMIVPDLPDSLERIGELAFAYCLLRRKVRIPDRVSFIGRRAFEGAAGLEEAVLPSSVRGLSADAFQGCASLSRLRTRGEEGPLLAEDGVLFDRDAGSLVLYPPARKDPAYRVPVWVRRIGDRAFSGARRLRRLDLPEGLEEIGSRVFERTGIEYMRLPDSLGKEGGPALDILYTGSPYPRQALRGRNPVYFGDPRDLPESKRKAGCRGFLYGCVHHEEELLPWRSAYQDYMREFPLPYGELGREDRNYIPVLTDLALLSRDDARDLLEHYAGPEDIDLRALLLDYLKEEAGGWGGLSLEI